MYLIKRKYAHAKVRRIGICSEVDIYEEPKEAHFPADSAAVSYGRSLETLCRLTHFKTPKAAFKRSRFMSSGATPS